jgi:hypothetical protein
MTIIGGDVRVTHELSGTLEHAVKDFLRAAGNLLLTANQGLTLILREYEDERNPPQQAQGRGGTRG